MTGKVSEARKGVSATGRPIVTLTNAPTHMAAAVATRSGAAMTLRGWVFSKGWLDDGKPGWRECKLASVVRVDTCKGEAIVRGFDRPVRLFASMVDAAKELRA